MKRVILWVLGALVLVAIGGGAYVYSLVQSVDAVRVTDDVHMLTGLGGNVGVLRTSAGAVVVDSMTFESQGARIRERAEELGGGPVQALVNTHYHSDHTHGNPGFVAGTPVVATRRTADHLRFFDGEYWTDGAAGFLPNQTFDRARELRIGDKTVHLRHVGAGHTDGDLVVLFAEDRVLHTGDLVFNRRYPNIDLEAGGSVRAWIETLDVLLALDFERVIPGHGDVTDRAGIEAFQAFLRELWALGESAAREGLGLEETLEVAELTTAEGYGVIGIPLVFRLDRDFVVRRVWEEATGAVQPQNPPRDSR